MKNNPATTMVGCIANTFVPCMLRAQMVSLTIREQSLIAAVLVALATGSVIHHLRTRADDVTVVMKTPRLTAPVTP